MTATAAFIPRDYSLTGPESPRAVAAGLASAEWYHSDVPRKVMKDLMQPTAAALWLGSILPLVLIGGPRIYGTWHMVMTGLLQHGGLAEDVLDHRLNSRTVYMNPASRWIYWNMNDHVEHPMFPMVPDHALPRLHDLIKDDLPPPDRSIAQADTAMIRALWQLRIDPAHTIIKRLPPGARPYRAELHGLAVNQGGARWHASVQRSRICAHRKGKRN